MALLKLKPLSRITVRLHYKSFLHQLQSKDNELITQIKIHLNFHQRNVKCIFQTHICLSFFNKYIMIQEVCVFFNIIKY